MDSPYYSPEKYGLEILGVVDFSSGAYEFDYWVVWQDSSTGVLYWAQDSGCSCPTPFEYLGRDKMEHGTPHQALKALEERRKEADAHDYSRRYGQAESLELISKLMALPTVIEADPVRPEIEGTSS